MWQGIYAVISRHSKQCHLHAYLGQSLSTLLTKGFFCLWDLSICSPLDWVTNWWQWPLGHMSSFPKNPNAHFLKIWAFTEYSLKKITVPSYFTDNITGYIFLVVYPQRLPNALKTLPWSLKWKGTPNETCVAESLSYCYALFLRNCRFLKIIHLIIKTHTSFDIVEYYLSLQNNCTL